jgi:hypothetical protein
MYSIRVTTFSALSAAMLTTILGCTPTLKCTFIEDSMPGVATIGPMNFRVEAFEDARLEPPENEIAVNFGPPCDLVLSNAVRAGLRNYGFKINPSSYVYAIGGKINKMTIEKDARYWAVARLDIDIFVTDKASGQTLYQKKYATYGRGLSTTEKENSVYDRAMNRAILHAVNLIRRDPEIQALAKARPNLEEIE